MSYKAKLINEQIKEIMRLVFLTVKDKLDRKFGCFELFGFDFMIDDQMKVKLIEINTNPALFTDTSVQKELLPKLVEDIVKSSLSIHKYGKNNGGEEVKQFVDNELPNLQLHYDLIYKE